jgi:NADH-quinone oxidoreductase subunit N
VNPWLWSIGGLYLSTLFFYWETELKADERKKACLLLGASGLGAVALCQAEEWNRVLSAWMLLTLPLSFLCTASAKQMKRSLFGYFLSDFLSFLLLCLGVGFLFAQYKTISLGLMQEAIPQESQRSDLLLYAGLALCLTGFLTRLPVWPFHFGFLDRLRFGTWPVFAFSALAIALSTAAFGQRFFTCLIHPTLGQWRDFLGFLAMASAWAGGLAAASSKNPREFLSYALLAQGGWALFALVNAPADFPDVHWHLGVALGIPFFLAAYGFWKLESSYGVLSGRAVQGLLQRHPALGFLLATGLAGVAGLPMTAGFFARIEMLQATTRSGFAPGILGIALSWPLVVWATLEWIAKMLQRPEEGMGEPVRIKTSVFYWALALATWVAGYFISRAMPG